jgi:hypothetical protein
VLTSLGPVIEATPSPRGSQSSWDPKTPKTLPEVKKQARLVLSENRERRRSSASSAYIVDVVNTNLEVDGMPLETGTCRRSDSMYTQFAIHANPRLRVHAEQCLDWQETRIFLGHQIIQRRSLELDGWPVD